MTSLFWQVYNYVKIFVYPTVGIPQVEEATETNTEDKAIADRGACLTAGLQALTLLNNQAPSSVSFENLQSYSSSPPRMPSFNMRVNPEPAVYEYMGKEINVVKLMQAEIQNQTNDLRRMNAQYQINLKTLDEFREKKMKNIEEAKELLYRLKNQVSSGSSDSS